MPDTEEIIVYFESVAQAIMAEQALINRKFDVRVMPTPADIRPGCGFCLRFSPESLKNAIPFLGELNLPVIEAYQRKTGGGSYRKIDLADQSELDQPKKIGKK
jgi:hypothetical protein